MFYLSFVSFDFIVPIICFVFLIVSTGFFIMPFASCVNLLIFYAISLIYLGGIVVRSCNFWIILSGVVVCVVVVPLLLKIYFWLPSLFFPS